MEKLIRIFAFVCVVFFGFVAVPKSAEALTKWPDGQPLVGDAYHHGGQLLAFDNLRAEEEAGEWMKQHAKMAKPYVSSNHERETGWHCPSFDNGLPRRSEWKEEMMGQFFAGNEGCLFTRVLAQGWLDFGYVNERGDISSWCEVDYVLVVARDGGVIFILKDQHMADWEVLHDSVKKAGWQLGESDSYFSIDTDINYLTLLAVSKSSTVTEVTDVVIERIFERLPVVKSIKVAEYFMPYQMPYQWHSASSFYLDTVDETWGNICTEYGVNSSNKASTNRCCDHGFMDNVI